MKIRVKRGQLYLADLSPVIGSEQGGVRPVLVIQNDRYNTKSPREMGNKVVDATIVTGSDALSRAAIDYIVENNDAKNGAEVIFTLTGHDLSRDLKTAQEIVEIITQGGMVFRSADESHVMLDIHEAVGSVLNAIVSGAEDYPGEDGDICEDEDIMDDEGLVFCI
jgi:hypothetical protein